MSKGGEERKRKEGGKGEGAKYRRREEREEREGRRDTRNRSASFIQLHSINLVSRIKINNIII